VLPRASNLPPLRCLPKPRLPRHYLPPNRVRHKIGTDHLSRPPRVAICSPPPQGRRAAAARVSGERRVGGRTGRAEGPPTPPVAFAPPAPPRRRGGRAAPHRRLGRTDRPRRTARVGRTDREGRTYREGRAAAAPTTRPTRQAAAREGAAAPNECRALRETGRRRAGRGAHPRRPPARRSPRAARASVRGRPYHI